MSNSTRFYNGVSMLDRETKISAYYTAKSKNDKTGNIPQVYMMLSDIHPLEAQREGKDYAVCGDCKLRPVNNTTGKKENECYVKTCFGVGAIFNANKRGSIPHATINPKKPVNVQRHGAYAEPASLPQSTNNNIVSKAKYTLAYTHQWNKPEFNYLKSFCMASVHSKAEAIQAQALGFRTFRILDTACETLLENEKVCLNFTKQIQCKKCLACTGMQKANVRNIAIPKHK